ncbi:RICIN domain-containing protein [Streptomyces sp. NPDC000877]|uniref:RICIN domain-containing protein n=1 Tax=unclassified Streptomyces TaxID=2593676 RepID=UPI0033293FEF
MRTPLSGLDTPNVVRGSDLTATNGTYALTLQPGRVYTVTTTSGQAPGTATSPRRSQLALPYSDSFAGYSAGREARYFATMNGAFESASCAGGRSGQCLRQMAEVQPIKWTHENNTQPYTIMGELGWSNYTVSSDVLLEKSGATPRSSAGSWVWTTLADGTVPAPGTNSWHNSFSGGPAGLGTAGYYPVQYSNLSITPGTVPDLSGTYKIISIRSGKALGASTGGTANGTPIIQWTDNGGTNQQWRLVKIA